MHYSCDDFMWILTTSNDGKEGHSATLEAFGGDYGIYDYNTARIESTLFQQYSSLGYVKYPTLF